MFREVGDDVVRLTQELGERPLAEDYYAEIENSPRPTMWNGGDPAERASSEVARKVVGWSRRRPPVKKDDPNL